MQSRILAVLVLTSCAEGIPVAPLTQELLPVTYSQVDVLAHVQLGDVRCASDAWEALLTVEADGEGRKATLALRGPAFELDAGTQTHCVATGEAVTWTLLGTAAGGDPEPDDTQSLLTFSACEGEEGRVATGTMTYDTSRARLQDVACSASAEGPVLLSVGERELYRE